MKYLSTFEVAEKWGISPRRVGILCNNDRIPGAQRAGSRWIIPEDAEKPTDARIKSGKYIKQKTDRGELQRFWQRYFLLEKGVYEKLLTNPDEKVEGTVKELADKYNLSVMEMTGFLDGINDSLVEPNPIDTMEEDTKVSLAFDKEKLYKNMVDAKADWLYELPQWNEIFDGETKRRLYLEQKKSGTVIVGKKIGRNDPCPCGSGKKYKYCCMNK